MSEYDKLLRELDGAGFELESRAAATIRRLREERDAARHNSFTESADRDRLAERVRELEQEREALRADFEKHADHSYDCGEELLSQSFARASSKSGAPVECTCGLDAVRERWARKPCHERTPDPILRPDGPRDP